MFLAKQWSTSGDLLERDTNIHNQPVIRHLPHIIYHIVLFQFIPDIDGKTNQEKRQQLLEGEDEFWESVKKWEKHTKLKPEFIENLS